MNLTRTKAFCTRAFCTKASFGIFLLGALSMNDNSLAADAADDDSPANAPIAIVVHGGAGTIRREDLGAEREAEIRAALGEAARKGRAILEQGGSSLDAVMAAVVVLEDSPHFNAGRGAVYNAEGAHELDAAIMDGATLRAGAVACVGTPTRGHHERDRAGRADVPVRELSARGVCRHG